MAPRGRNAAGKAVALSPAGVTRELIDEQRALEAMKLKVDGKTWEEIADALGYPGRKAAAAAVQRLRQGHIIEALDDFLQYEHLRLEKYTNELEQFIAELKREAEAARLNGKSYSSVTRQLPRVIEVLVKVSQERSELLGLHKKDRQEVSAQETIVLEYLPRVADASPLGEPEPRLLGNGSDEEDDPPPPASDPGLPGGREAGDQDDSPGRRDGFGEDLVRTPLGLEEAEEPTG